MKQITSGGNWLFNWSKFSLGVAQISVYVLTVALLCSCNEGKDASPSSKGGVSAPEMTPLIAKVAELSADLAKVQQEVLSYQRAAKECAEQNQQLATALKDAKKPQAADVDVDNLLAIGTSRADILKRLGGPKSGFVKSMSDNEWTDSGPFRTEAGFARRNASRFIEMHLPGDLNGSGGRQSHVGKAVSAYQWDGYLVFFDPEDNLIFWCRSSK